MGKRNKTVVGRYEDVRIGAAKTGSANAFAEGTGKPLYWSREIHDIVEAVRYHTDNDYARVAYAIFHKRSWKKTRLKRSTFYKMKNEVKILLTRINIGRNARRKRSQKGKA